MNGSLIKNTPIAVDLWSHQHLRDANFFFLTHLHEDHIKGLTSSWRSPIYTSPINKTLLDKRFLFSHDLVIPLELNEPHIIPLNTKNPSSMSVTLIDANHVPGAVMFLFQGYFGNILYCGDMRFKTDMLNHPSIEEPIRSGGIDQLYLDNTFCCPSYNFFSRECATQQVFNIIEDHPNHCIKLGIRKLGKEDLLEKIAIKFKERILVSQEKYEQLKLIGRLDVYTTNPKESRIEALIMQKIHARNHLKWNQYKPTVSIKLTALYFGIKDYFSTNKYETMYTVPYSDHSSWGELHEFVKGLKPRKIFPIVKPKVKKDDFISKALSSRYDMSVFESYLIPQCTSAATTSVPEFIDKKFDVAKQKLGCGESQRKFLQKKRKVNNKGILYESLHDSSEEEHFQTVEEEITSTSHDFSLSKDFRIGKHFVKEECSGIEAYQNNVLPTNSFCDFKDSSTFLSACSEVKMPSSQSIYFDFSETTKISNKEDDTEEELDKSDKTSLSYITFIDECSKDLSRICGLYNSLSEEFVGFEVNEHNSLSVIKEKLISFVKRSQLSQSNVMEKSSNESLVNDTNCIEVDKFEGFEDNEDELTKGIKKKLLIFIEDCLNNTVILSQTTKMDISEQSESSEINNTHDSKFEGFNSGEQSFNLIRGKLLHFVEGCASANVLTLDANSFSPKLCSTSISDNTILSPISISDANVSFASSVSDINVLSTSSVSDISILSTPSVSAISVLSTPSVSDINILSTPSDSNIIDLSTSSVRYDKVSSLTSVCDDNVSSGSSVSDVDVSSALSLSGKRPNKLHQDSVASAHLEHFTSDDVFKKDLFDKLESSLVDLKERNFRKLNVLFDSVECYLKTF